MLTSSYKYLLTIIDDLVDVQEQKDIEKMKIGIQDVIVAISNTLAESGQMEEK